MWLCLWIAGCGGGCGGAQETAEQPPTNEPSDHAATPDEAADPAEPVEVVDPGPRPVLRISGQPDAHEGSVVIRVENRGAESAELAGALGLQRQQGDAWQDVEVQLDLRFSCDDAAPECVTLAPGAAYIPPPWLGVSGDAQCACEECGPAADGEYRFVVRSCNGAHTLEGEPFTFSAP